MSDSLDKAFVAIRDWHAKQTAAPSLPDLRHGDRVVELGGDGSTLIIAGFEREGRGEYSARCLKPGTDQVLTIPVSRIKPEHQNTLH